MVPCTLGWLFPGTDVRSFLIFLFKSNMACSCATVASPLNCRLFSYLYPKFLLTFHPPPSFFLCSVFESPAPPPRRQESPARQFPLHHTPRLFFPCCSFHFWASNFLVLFHSLLGSSNCPLPNHPALFARLVLFPFYWSGCRSMVFNPPLFKKTPSSFCQYDPPASFPHPSGVIVLSPPLHFHKLFLP